MAESNWRTRPQDTDFDPDDELLPATPADVAEELGFDPRAEEGFANEGSGCGTGAGGFQPGNTCAKGSGGGGEAPLNRVQRPPLPRKDAASFDAAAWAAKPVPDRVKEWSAMGQGKRDELADAANSVPARRKELLAPLGERPAPTGDAKADAKARVAQASEHVTRYAAAKIEKQAGRYADLLGEAGIEGEQAATLVAHATDELLAQEMEGMRRQLGDHGISHIGGNIERGLSILDAVPGDHTPQDRLQIVISNIYHDTGYMTGPSRTFLDEGHPRWSAEHYNNEVKPMVKAALGSRVANEIEHDIRTHAATSINWQEDAAGSAVRVADNTGLFQRDKLPPLFRHAPKNIEVLGRLSRKEVGLDEARAEMQANVAAAKLPEPVTAALGEAVKEVGPMTGKFTLGMLGGHIEKVRWAGDHVAIDLSEDKALTELHKIGDFGQRQFGKFAESYGVDPERFKKELSFELRDRAGKMLLESRVVKTAGNGRVGISGAEWVWANAGGFDEAQHPRDDAGKFAPKEGGGRTDTPEFKAWFAGSKVVDDQGKPLRVFHGTDAKENFSVFNRAGTKDAGWYGRGFYFSKNPSDASEYAAYYSGPKGTERIIPAFISLQNPIVASDRNELAAKIQKLGGDPNLEGAKLTQELQRLGFDGVIGRDGTEIVAFKPTQIKSVFNRGTWSKDDPDIGNERPDARTSPGCGRRFDAAGMREIAIGAVACPECGKRVAQAANEFDEDQPRDAGGKWTRLYHGTPGGAFKTLKPNANGVVFLARDQAAAEFHAGKDGTLLVAEGIESKNPLVLIEDIEGPYDQADELKRKFREARLNFPEADIQITESYDNDTGDKAFIQKAKSSGYDSIVTGDGSTIALFGPVKVKHAVGGTAPIVNQSNSETEKDSANSGTTIGALKGWETKRRGDHTVKDEFVKENLSADSAVFATQGHVPDSLNGVPFAPVKDYDASKVPDVAVDEPPLPHLMPHEHMAAGVIVTEPDGRVWLYEPKNHWAGYQNTFSKGTQEEGMTLQQTALKELHEETGLTAEIKGYVGDWAGTQSVSRFYHGVRTGGSPVGHKGDETLAVKLVTPDDAGKILNTKRDQKILHALADKGIVKRPATKPEFVPRPEPEYVGGKHWSETPEPAQKWSEPKVGTSGHAWQPQPKPVAPQPKKPMLWTDYLKNFGNEGGKVCGDSFISPDKVCRLLEAIPAGERRSLEPFKIGGVNASLLTADQLQDYARMEKAPVAMFHGTVEDFVGRIKTVGLTPNPERVLSPLTERGTFRESKVFATAKFDAARFFAEARAKSQGGKPAVVELLIPNEEFTKMQVDAGTWESDQAFTADRIPASWIVTVHHKEGDTWRRESANAASASTVFVPVVLIEAGNTANEFIEEDHPRDAAGKFAPKRPEFQTSNPKQKAENEAALDKVEEFAKAGDKAALAAMAKHPSPKVAAYAKAHAEWSGGKAAPAAPKPAALPPAPTFGSSNPQQVAQNQAAVAEAQAAHKAGDAAALAKLAAHPSPKVAGYAKALAASLPGSPVSAPSAPVAAPEPPKAAVMPSKPPKAASGQQAGGNPAPEAAPDSPQAKAAAALRLAAAEKLGTTPDKVRETARGSGHYKDAAAVKARVALESALLEHGLAVQDAGVEVAKLVDEKANAAWLAGITEGDATKNAKFLANVPAHDLSVLSKVTWDTKPHGGLACCDMHARTILMGSNSTNSGDSRHELGHAVHGYWLQGGGPMAQRVEELHNEATAKFKADPAAAGMKEAQKLGKKIDHDYAETHWGVAGSRSLDDAKEDAAEHFRLYQRQVYRELKEGKAGAVAQYRARHPGWAALWDSHYSAALAAL